MKIENLCFESPQVQSVNGKKEKKIYQIKQLITSK